MRRLRLPMPDPRPLVFSLRTGTLPDPVFLTAVPTQSAASALGVGFRLRPSPVVFLTGKHRLSQVPGISTHPSAPHSDAGRATPHLVKSARHGAVPPGSSRKTSTMKFRHSTTRLRDPLHTVAIPLRFIAVASRQPHFVSCRPYGTTTQCSLTAGDQPLPCGSGYPPDINCTFHVHLQFLQSRHTGLTLAR